jgi:hypothetical protein
VCIPAVAIAVLAAIELVEQLDVAIAAASAIDGYSSW